MTDQYRMKLEQGLFKAIDKWATRVSESDEWASIGYCGDNLIANMTKAAMLILVANSEASHVAEESK